MFGDMIEQARIVPYVAKHCPDATLTVPASLARLFSRLGIQVREGDLGSAQAIDRLYPFLPYEPNPSSPGCVRQVPLPPFEQMELPPLWADGRIVLERDATRRLLVGLCWHGSGGGRSAPGLDDDPRCIAVDLLRPIVTVPDVQFVALQLADWASALQALPEGQTIPSLSDLGVQDYADTAGILQQLDLVITIDSAIAHLAGTLGIPTWLLLISPRHPGWDQGRWGRADAVDQHGRSRPPLYSSVTQFRQSDPGDWAGVVAQVSSAVALLFIARVVAGMP